MAEESAYATMISTDTTLIDKLASMNAQCTSILNIVKKYANFRLFEGNTLFAKWRIPNALRRHLWNDRLPERQLQCVTDEKGLIYVYEKTLLTRNRHNFAYSLYTHTLVFVYDNFGQQIKVIKLAHVYFESLKVINNKIYVLYPNYICIEDIHLQHTLDPAEVISIEQYIVEENAEANVFVSGDFEIRSINKPHYFKEFGRSVTLLREIYFDIPQSATSFIVLPNENFVVLTRQTMWFLNSNGILLFKVSLKSGTNEDKICPSLEKVRYTDITLSGNNTIVLMYFASGGGFGCLLYSTSGRYLRTYWNESNTPIVRKNNWFCSIQSVKITPNSETLISYGLNGGTVGVFSVYTSTKTHLRNIIVPMEGICIADPIVLHNGKLFLATTTGFQIWT